MRRLNDQIDAQVAVSGSNWAAAITGIKKDSTAFGRARFIFQFGPQSATSASLSTGLGIWKAATSGGTFAAIAGASLVAVTSGVLGGNVMVIDVPTDSANPWLLVSAASIISTAIIMSAVVEFYNGINRPPTASPQQVVVV